MTESLTQQTGSFCTACKLSAKDVMNEDLMSQPLYMDLGTDELNMTFKMLAEKLYIAEDEIDTCELPAKPGDYSSRFGIKRAPMTDKFEITKIVSVLHAAKLRAIPFLEELIQRDLSGCRVWGKGRIPVDQKARLEDTKEKWKQLMGGVLGFCGKQAPNQLIGLSKLLRISIYHFVRVSL